MLPLIGEIEYYRYLSKSIKPTFLGKFHLIAKDPIERGEFAVNLNSLTEQMARENKIDQITKDQATKTQIRKEAYVIGIIFVHFHLF